jgi:hypothetical protein
MNASGSACERRAGIGILAVGAMAVVAIALVLASPARASIIVGADLASLAADPAQASDCAPAPSPCTTMLFEVPQGSSIPAASPAAGTVVAFDIETGGPSTVTFRLLRLDAAVAGKVILASGVGTGPTVDLPGPGTYEFPTSLPIRVGDRVGVDSSSLNAYSACRPFADSLVFSPPLPDGGSLQTPMSSKCELLVNAVVLPSATVGFGKGTVDRASGRAKLGLRLPGPGELTLTGPGIGRVSKRFAWADRLNLPIRLRSGARKRVTRRGSAELRLAATFAPVGGEAASQSALVRFRLVGRAKKR